MLALQTHVDLTPLNSLHLQSAASNYVLLEHVEQLEEIRSIIGTFPRFFILGGGSNLILPTMYQGLVIHNQLHGISICERGDERIVTAMAGENWDCFVDFCCSQGAYGLENLSLIPGTVGASPIQNIGAYGVEVKDFIDEIVVYDLHLGQQIKLSNKDCQFTYRNSFLKNNTRYIVISVSFKLSTVPRLNVSYGDVAQRIAALNNPSPNDLRNIIIEIRQNKLPDPNELGNAGSFFHNPILPEEKVQQLQMKYPDLPTYPTPNPGFLKVSAGWLIDQLGLKGLRENNVGIYSKQALVLINYGGAIQSELLKFAERIQSEVYHNYAIQLHIEPIILNC